MRDAQVAFIYIYIYIYIFTHTQLFTGIIAMTNNLIMLRHTSTQKYLYQSLFIQELPGARRESSHSIVAKHPRNASRALKSATQGLYNRANAFTWLPVSQATFRSPRRRSAPLGDPVTVFPRTEPGSTFREGEWVMLVSVCWDQYSTGECYRLIVSGASNR